MKLNSFTKTTKDRKRVARGARSGFGRTAGRGQKGYKARSGSTVKGFEGGQTPIYRRLPMRGFNSKKESAKEVSLKRLVCFVGSKISEINPEVLVSYGVIKDSEKANVRLIGSDIDIKKIEGIKKIFVCSASASVIEKLKKAGVEVVLNK